jgi:hypothetical protein
MSSILPICKSCYKLLADIQNDFEMKYKLITFENQNKEEQTDKIEKLFNEFDITNMCCKIRLITSIKYENLVQK